MGYLLKMVTLVRGRHFRKPKRVLFKSNRIPKHYNLQDKHVWSHLVSLPDDVSITTFSRDKTLVECVTHLKGQWLAIIDIYREYKDNVIIHDTICHSYDYLQSSIFNAFHGFYKESISCLRNFLEHIIVGFALYFSNNLDIYNEWVDGANELKFDFGCSKFEHSSIGRNIDKMLDFPFFKCKNEKLKFDGGTIRLLWSALSIEVHACPDKTNAKLWQSNGPIYSKNGFDLFLDYFYTVFIVGLILIKIVEPKFNIDNFFNVFYIDNIKNIDVKKAFIYIFQK